MPSIVHVVTTGNFAGVERYVCDTARETATRGWDVAVVGGDPARMEDAAGPDVRWLPGATATRALASLARLGRQDVCHAHLTIAEAVALAARPFHRAPVVSTRHIAAARGSSIAGRLLAPWIARGLAREIAVSEFVAGQIDRLPDAVITNGVPPVEPRWQPAHRVVLVMQRLEREKDTLTALQAWQASGLADDGWTLRVVGDGAERKALEEWAKREGAPAEFAGWTARVSDELAGAGIFLAPAPAEPFGLAVVEALAAGVPVVACAAGGHLETVGRLPGAPMFPAGDAQTAAEALRSLLPEEARKVLSRSGRELVGRQFTLAQHVDRLLEEYEFAQRRPEPASELRELVVCSLEPWDDVWRRNQFLTDGLLRRNPKLRVLFVEPAADPTFDLWSRRRPRGLRIRSVSSDGRLRAFRPVKLLPRRAGPLADRLLLDQVRLAVKALGFSRPMLWLNDLTYAPLIQSTGWPSLYDVTDDWLLAPFSSRELDRLRELEQTALAHASEVVVCSPALAETRGRSRPVALVPNGVDVEHFRRARPRPADLPASPASVYVGSLHDARLDVELVLELARALSSLQVVLIGPDSLDLESRRRLAAEGNVHLLGPRPYGDVPAYLQHAAVIVVPHLVSPFTDSLDPIKAYECLAVETPTVSTPIAGFREHGGEVVLAPRASFVSAVATALAQGGKRALRQTPTSWDERVQSFESVLVRAQGRAR